MFFVSVYLEMLAIASGKIGDCLVWQVYTHLCLMVFINAFEQLFEERLANHYWQNKIVELVVLVDICKE